MNFKPIFAYRWRENAIGGASFFAVIILVTGLLTATMLLYPNNEINTNFSAFGMASGILFLVLGITSIREDLRLGSQCGISRNTVLLGNLASGALLAVLLSVAGSVLQGLFQLLVGTDSRIIFTDFYQMLFLNSAMTLPHHIYSVLFNLINWLLTYALGMFCSLLFYRLNKIWTVVVAVAMAIILFAGLPILGWQLAPLLLSVMEWATTGVWHWSALMLPCLVVTLAVDYLLLRRAPIKGLK